MTTMSEREAVAVADSKAAMRVYRFTRRVIRWTLLPFYRVNASGAANLAIGGPLIVAPVHRSNIDAPLLGAIGRRRLRSLAKRSLFHNKLFGWYVAALGGVPLDREIADRAALRAVRDLLDRGEAVLIFPEGTRQQGDDIGELFDGPAYLAAKTSARVVPIGISGTEAALPPGRKLPRRTHVGIAVGEPMDPPGMGGNVTLSDRRAFSAELGVRLRKLQQEAKVLAAQPG